jgi:pyoverdine/dityrosine biosynthesis protein Dit1
MKDQGHSKRNELASAAAKEMLRRKQAYGHLVEILHPRAIRLSIHQHKNDGPKLAINTLPKTCFKPIQKMEEISFEKEGNAARVLNEEEAHIPTPWHSVLMEVEGHSMTYVCKNGLVLDEQEDPNSPWDCEWRDKGRGARWYLKQRE